MRTTEKTASGGAPVPVHPKRPFLLTLLCCFSFPFFGLISLLLLISVFYSGFFTGLINTYIVGKPVTTTGVFFILLLLFALYAAGVAGTWMMWRMKRRGYYVFGIPVLAISVYQLFQSDVPALSTAILISMLVLFGAFLRKLN